MLGELEDGGRTIVFDMEAGAGTLLRMAPDTADAVLVVVEPSAKSIQAAQRLTDIAASQRRTLLLANKIRSDDEIDEIRAAFPELETIVVPYDPVIERSDRDGSAPVDGDSNAAGVAALRSVAVMLTGNA